ncbi:MAG: carboxyltransferase domain-containing protein [Pseudomonadota bacterium]
MDGYPRIETVGLSGLLVTFAPALDDAANRAALAFRAAMRGAWIEESATSLVSAFFRADLAQIDVNAARADLEALLGSRDWYGAPLPSGRKLWRIPAVFGGDLAPGLAGAAEAAGVTEDQAIEEICKTGLRVITIGFAPGQPYLGTLAPHWDIPRLTGLTPNVPAGALVAAVRQICLFSNDTPTGWRHVGQTNFRTFRPDRDAPFPLSPGDELRFEPVSAAEFARLEGADGARFEVSG